MTRLPLLLLLLGVGCGTDVHFDDDFDPAFDIDLSDDNELHQPYATGTQVRIDVHNLGSDTDTTGWSFETSDPSVLRIDSVLSTGRAVQLTAIGEGAATLTLRDEDGDALRSARIEVATPDRARLFARGPLRHGLGALAQSERPQVLVDSTAVFEVRYFRGEQRVFGQQMLVATSPDASMELTTRETSWEAKAEWLEVVPTETGPRPITLAAGTADLGTVEVAVVDASVIAHVDLHGREGDNRAGDTLTILATAWDADGSAVWGAPFRWTLDGDDVEGEGDILTYRYEPSSARELVLAANGATESTTIHAADDVAVSSSASVGCSASGQNATPWPLLLAVTAVGLASRRKRR